MRVFIQQGYQKNDLKCLNQCRIYTHSVYLSDICMASGDTLEKYQWKSPIQIPSTYKWPLTQKPTPNKWTFWQCTLQQALSLGTSLTLLIQLGRWAQQSLGTQEWFYLPHDKALYHCNNDGWYCHTLIPWWTHTKNFHRASQPLQVPPEATHLTVALIMTHGKQHTLTGVGDILVASTSARGAWHEKLQDLEVGKVWNIQINITGSEDQIREAIGARQGIAVSDGSFQQGCSTAAWIIEGTTL